MRGGLSPWFKGIKAQMVKSQRTTLGRQMVHVNCLIEDHRIRAARFVRELVLFKCVMKYISQLKSSTPKTLCIVMQLLASISEKFENPYTYWSGATSPLGTM